MRTGLSNELQKIDDSHNSAVINRNQNQRDIQETSKLWISKGRTLPLLSVQIIGMNAKNTYLYLLSGTSYSV